MGAFLAVARGSQQEPKFIHIKYTPKTLQNVLQSLVKAYALIVAEWT